MIVHPVDVVPLVPDDRSGTQLDLLREGPVVDAVIDEGLAHPRDLKGLREAKEAGLSSIGRWHDERKKSPII